MGHPPAEQLLERAKVRDLPVAEVTFRYDQHPTRISIVEQLQGCSGWLRTTLFTIEALEPEQHLVLSAIDDDGTPIDAERCQRLFMVAGEVGTKLEVPEPVPQTSLFEEVRP